MGESLGFRQYDHHGKIIDGDTYNCCLFVCEEPPYPQPEQPDDGKEYFILTVKYVHFDRPPGRQRCRCLFQRQRALERDEFYSSAAAVLAGMLSDAPWRLPEALLGPAAPWMCSSARDAIAMAADFPEFLGFQTARVLYLEMMIDGPYLPGGDDVVEEDNTDNEDNEPAVPQEVIDALESVKIGGDDDGIRVRDRVSGDEGVVIDDRTCSICLEDFIVGSDDVVVRMPCSHIFHKLCVAAWLETSNSCPYCRQALPSSS